MLSKYDQKRPNNTERHAARDNTRTPPYHHTGDTMETNEHARAIYDLQSGDGIMIPNCKSYHIHHTISMLWATMQLPYNVDAYVVHETDNGNTFISVKCNAKQTIARMVCGQYGRYNDNG